MDPRSSLTTLPNELTNAIFRHICADKDKRKESLGNLRLTCKHLSAHATRTFAGYFTEVPILMTRDGLQALVDVCGHPIFGPAVRTVKLSSLRICRHKPGKVVSETISNTFMSHSKTKERAQELVKSGMDRIFYEGSIVIHEQVRLLTVAFSSLARIGNSIQLVISYRERTSIGRTIQSVKLPTWEAKHFHDEGMWKNEFRDTLQMSMYAADEADCVVDCIKMEVWTHGTEPPGRDDHIALKLWDVSNIFPAWAFVRTVIFDLAGREASLGYDTLDGIMSLTQNVTDFRWSLRSSDPFDRGFGKTTSNTVSNSMERISINSAWLSKEHVTSLIYRNCATLSYFTIHEISCYDDSWHSVITDIRNNLSRFPHLGSMSLELFGKDLGETNPWERFEGKENIESGLLMVLEHLPLPP